MPPAMAQGSTEVGGVRVMSRTFQGLDAKDLKPLADEAKPQLGSGVVAMANGEP